MALLTLSQLSNPNHYPEDEDMDATATIITTEAVGIAGQPVDRGEIVEVTLHDARVLCGMDKARMATPEEIAALSAPIVSAPTPDPLAD